MEQTSLFPLSVLVIHSGKQLLHKNMRDTLQDQTSGLPIVLQPVLYNGKTVALGRQKHRSQDSSW